MEDSKDLISRQAAIDALDCINGVEEVLKALPSAQPERLTDDDFETIRIHLNAYKEKLCNERRWKEAEGYQRIIDRFIAFASAQPEQRWIPLGRPMSGGMYLVTLRQKFEGKESYRVRIMRLNEGHWMLPKHFPEWINEEIEQEVIAWMPLPEPYKGGEQNDDNGTDRIIEKA